MSRESTQELRQRLLRNPEVQNMIRVRAFQIYERSGRVPNQDAENWFQAEQEIISILIDEEQRRADDVRRSGNTTATIPESEISAIGSAGRPSAAAGGAARGQTAEEQAESQSALGVWSATEPASEERAPAIGESRELQTEAPANKGRARATSKSTATRKTESEAATKEGPPKKTARRSATKKADEPAARKAASKKRSKTEEGA